MKYEYQDVYLLFKKMAVETKELWHTMKQVDDLLHDPEFEKVMMTFNKDELEQLDRFFRIYDKYGIELREVM